MVGLDEPPASLPSCYMLRRSKKKCWSAGSILPLSSAGTVDGRVVKLVEMPTAGISDGQVTGLSGLIK
jgi:hypothetical protein